MALHVPTKVCIGGHSRVRGVDVFVVWTSRKVERHYVWAREGERANEQARDPPRAVRE